MFGFVISAAKYFGKGKAMAEAIDDDVDLDGVSEVDELKGSYHVLLGYWNMMLEKMFPELKNFFSIFVGLVNHIAKAGDKQEPKK